MASVNKVILVGNLGRDPEIRYMPSGDAMANLNIATTDTWKDKEGEKQEKTEWHRVVMFGKQAEIAGEYLKKGSQVYIEGRLQTRKWTDKSNIERYTTEIVADRMQMLEAVPVVLVTNLLTKTANIIALTFQINQLDNPKKVIDLMIWKMISLFSITRGVLEK